MFADGEKAVSATAVRELIMMPQKVIVCALSDFIVVLIAREISFPCGKMLAIPLQGPEAGITMQLIRACVKHQIGTFIN